MPRMRTLLTLLIRPSLRIIMAENNCILEVTNKVEAKNILGARGTHKASPLREEGECDVFVSVL